jgi:hypothetical protein
MSETAGAVEAPIQSSAPGEGTTQQSGPGTETQTQTNPSFVSQTPPAEDAAPPASEAEPAGAPEGDPPSPEVEAPPAEPPDYSSLTLPEGLTVEDPILGAFLDAAKEKGQDPALVQSIVDSVAPKMMEALQAPYREWQNTQREWTAAIHSDPEIGGQNVAKVQAVVARMLDNPVFCDPDLRQVMDYTGAGNNPAVVRSLYRIASALTEGHPTAVGRPAPQPRSAAEVLYGTPQNRT